MLSRFLSNITQQELPNWVYDEQKEPAFSVGIWDVYDATKKNCPNNTKASVWVSTNSENKQFALNQALVLKQVRHPYVLKLLDTSSNCSSGGGSSFGMNAGGSSSSADNLSSKAGANSSSADASNFRVLIVTEQVRPLMKPFLENNVWALFQVTKALQFLINNSNKNHNLLDLFSLFVTEESNDCRLGGFELCASNDGAYDINSELILTKRRGNHQLRENGLLNVFELNSNQHLDFLGLHAIFKTAGLFDDLNATVRQAPASVVTELKNLEQEMKTTRAVSGRHVTNATKTLLQRVLDCQFFKQNPVIRIMQYLEEFHVKEAVEKYKFFETILPAQLDAIKNAASNASFASGGNYSSTTPSGGAGSTTTKTFNIFSLIRPHILQAHKFSAPELKPVVFPIMLRICEETSDKQEFQQYCQPFILEQFKAPDRAIRYRLLTALFGYVFKMEETIVRTTIFDSLQNGFNDQNASIREATVKAMVVLCMTDNSRQSLSSDPASQPTTSTPLIPIQTIQDKVAKQLQQRLRDPEPSLRTNVCICFGKIATLNGFGNPELNPGSDLPVTSRILKAAFSVSINDSFMPCRLATLQAVRACLNYFTMVDLCNTVCPLVAAKVILSPVEQNKPGLNTAVTPAEQQAQQEEQKNNELVAQQVSDLAMEVLQAVVSQIQKLKSEMVSSVVTSTTSGSGSASSVSQPGNSTDSRSVPASRNSNSSSSGWGGWAFSKIADLQGSISTTSGAPANNNSTPGGLTPTTSTASVGGGTSNAPGVVVPVPAPPPAPPILNTISSGGTTPTGASFGAGAATSLPSASFSQPPKIITPAVPPSNTTTSAVFQQQAQSKSRNPVPKSIFGSTNSAAKKLAEEQDEMLFAELNLGMESPASQFLPPGRGSGTSRASANSLLSLPTVGNNPSSSAPVGSSTSPHKNSSFAAAPKINNTSTQMLKQQLSPLGSKSNLSKQSDPWGDDFFGDDFILDSSARTTPTTTTTNKTNIIPAGAPSPSSSSSHLVVVPASANNYSAMSNKDKPPTPKSNSRPPSVPSSPNSSKQSTGSPKQGPSAMFAKLEKPPPRKEPVPLKKAEELKKEAEDAFWDEFD
ncbi:unnamed protein product [Amoebophrya sp. A120]|nr:unnamed protein product [Amoebophrya sp. A120]|eukprot:GSA120T00007322001.1